MALSESGLAGEIIRGIGGNVNKNNMVDKTMQAIGHAIARYIVKNTSVKFNWNGIMPGSPPSTDSATTYTTTKLSGDFICSPTGTTDPTRHGILMGKQITDGIKKLLIYPASGWLLPPTGFLCLPSIVLQPYPTRNQYQYWLFESKIILKYLKSWVKNVPLMGAHGAFIAPAGTGAIMNKIF